MNLHKNARTCPKSRALMVSRVLEDGRPVAVVAEEFGVSRRHRGAGWEYVHVCVDDYSRVAYAEVLPDERKDSAVAFLKRAVKWFARFGITVRRVLTDNGSCYRSKLFQPRCQAMGIRKKYTRPYRPQTNGKAERFIQTLLREWAYARIYITSNERKTVLPIYLTHYNYHRQHGSLNSNPPITRMPGVCNVAGIHS